MNAHYLPHRPLRVVGLRSELLVIVSAAGNLARRSRLCGQRGLRRESRNRFKIGAMGDEAHSYERYRPNSDGPATAIGYGPESRLRSQSTRHLRKESSTTRL